MPSSYPYPDEQSWWNAYRDEVVQRYERAGRPFPPGYDFDAFKWWSRAAWDIGAGMEPDAAKRKHLRELERALGLEPESVPIDLPALFRTPRVGASVYGDFGDPGWNYPEIARILAGSGMQLKRVWSWGGWRLDRPCRFPFLQAGDGRFKLFSWNESYFDEAERYVELHNSLGMLVQWTLVDMYAWHERKGPGIPGSTDQNFMPFRYNHDGIHWAGDRDLVYVLPDAWLTEFVERLVGRLKSYAVWWELGNEMPEKDFHRRMKDLVKRVHPAAVVTVSRNVDEPGQYGNMKIGRDYDRIAFHGWPRIMGMRQPDTAHTGRPETFQDLFTREGGSRIIVSSDGARSSNDNVNTFDWGPLLDSFRYAKSHGASIEHMSRVKMVLHNEGRYDLSFIEQYFLQQLASL